MTRTPGRYRLRNVFVLFGVAGLIAGAVLLPAGEPIPDIDVILEQNPGGEIAIEVLPPIDYDGDPIPDVDVILEQLFGFDSVRLSGDKALLDLSVVDLPAGWGMRRDGKRLLLGGPAVVPPVRFKLETRSARPERVDVELLRGKEVRFSRMKVNPRIVPQRVVANTLSGTVRLPPRVSPGETIALRSLPGATLPPGGTWMISGTVSEPWDEDDLRHARTLVHTTRSNIKSRADLEPQPARLPVVLLGDGDCESLAPVAAVLQAREGATGGEPLRVSRLESGEASRDGVFVADLSPKTQHDVAKGSIRNLKFFFTVADEPPPGIAINEEEDLVTERVAASQVAPRGDRGKQQGKKEAWTASAADASHAVAWTWTAPGALADLEPGRPKAAAFDGEPVAGGCRFLPRQPSDLDLARWARMQAQAHKPGRPTGKPEKSAIHFVTLPVDLRPGEPISARYLDAWGDPWVEVAEVPDVEVVPPAPEGESPTIESASPYAVAGDPVCVCGAFSPLDTVAAFSLASRPAEVVSISGRVAWLLSPADFVGPALIQAEGMRGEAATDLLQVRAELDQEHLFSGQSTPLRIVVEGTTAPLPIRIYTGTPQVIELEGGPDQQTETSGGAVNQVVRQVRGLVRGSFQLSWELRPPTCPCAEPD